MSIHDYDRNYLRREYNTCCFQMSISAKLATERVKNLPDVACFYQEQAAKWATRMFTCKLLYDRVGKENDNA